MGSWSMHIHGHGVHDNGHPDDADSFLREFVSALRHRGHVVHAAHFTAGPAKDVTLDPTIENTPVSSGTDALATPAGPAEVPAEVASTEVAS